MIEKLNERKRKRQIDKYVVNKNKERKKGEWKKKK